MENASKALIIAGAILISILLISVGVLIMNSTGGITGSMKSSSDSMAMQAFNSQFSSYIGTSISASQVKSLLSTIISSNASDDNHIIKVTTSGTGFASGAAKREVSTAADISAINKGVKSTYKFTVEADYDDVGYINKITIK